MSAIDTSTWGEFRVDELFRIVKGARLTTAQRLPGEIPYVGASQFNNGITHYIGNDEKLHPGGVLSVCYNGPVGTTFYQPDPFWATDDVNVLYPKDEVSMEALLFVAPAIAKIGSEYAYIDKWKLSDMESAKIRLPQTSSGEPDWEFMERRMFRLIERQELELDTLVALSETEPQQIDVSEWGEFVVGQMFTVQRPSARSVQQYLPGNVPFVASGDFDNAVVGFCEPKAGEVLDQGNCVTISPVDGSASYQPADFLGRGGAGSSIFKLYNDSMEESSGVFIAAVMQATFSRLFGYSDMGNGERIKEAVIKLPVTPTGEPDWAYMESTMRELMGRQGKALDAVTRFV